MSASLHEQMNQVVEALHVKRTRTISQTGVADWEFGANRLHRAGVFAKTNAQNLVAFVVDEFTGQWMAENSPKQVLAEIDKDFALIKALREIYNRTDDSVVLQPVYDAVEAMLRRLDSYIVAKPKA